MFDLHLWQNKYSTWPPGGAAHHWRYSFQNSEDQTCPPRPLIFFEGEKWKCLETTTKIMNVISKPARQALVGWGDQEEQGLTVNGVKLAGKLPLKMPINSEPSCFTSYPIIRSNYKMSPNHRSGNSWIHMYILYIYIYSYIHIYKYIGVAWMCPPPSNSGKGIPS